MARKRMIDPHFWETAQDKGWGPNECVIMLAAISASDDEGRGRISELNHLVHGIIHKNKIKKSMRSLQDSIISYRKIYFILPKFKEYNKISHPTPSKIPPPTVEEYNSYLNKIKDLASDSTGINPESFQKTSKTEEFSLKEINIGESKELPRSDVEKFFLEQKQSLTEANKFYDYYASRNWKIDGEKITDWKPVARNWINRIGEFEAKKKNNGHNNQLSSTLGQKDQGFKEVLKHAEDEIKKHGKFKGFDKVESGIENKTNDDLPI